jgi:hypothetical protein
VSLHAASLGLRALAVALLVSPLAAGQGYAPRPPVPRRATLRPTQATAAAPPSSPVAARALVLHARPHPKEPPPVLGPTPDVKLALEAPTPKGTWALRVTNDGDVPVRLTADARLLTLEVTPRSAVKALRCELPPDMRPDDDMDRPLVLPPGRSYVERFEPRLYCFGQHRLDALAQGSIVVGRLGWPAGKTLRPPFAVESVAGVEPELVPLREIASPPIGLPDEPTPPRAVPPPSRPDDPDPVHLTLRGPLAVDAQSPNGISVNVTLHNAGRRPVFVRFRPETLRFSATSPGGIEDCRWPMPPVAAMRELFTRLSPGGTTDLSVLLDAYCAEQTLDRPGLLLLRPELDTREASGADIGLRTFDGRVVATTATVVRLHQGASPRQLRQPRLEPLVSSPPTPVADAPVPEP